MRVSAGFVNCRVNIETGRIDRILGRREHITAHVDSHQIGSGDLRVQQTVGVDQKLGGLVTHP